jgi:thiol-disulfide isomerase/thioredoxin
MAHMTSFSRVAAAVVVAGVVGGCATPRPVRRASRSAGQPLALTVPDLQGKPVDVGARNGAVRVIDFWATWCEPCREALPALDAMARDLREQGLVVYGVSVDEKREAIDAYLAKSPLGFPVLWDRGGEALARFDVGYMPVTLIVDRRGVIRQVHQGWDASQAERERAEVEALLAEPP